MIRARDLPHAHTHTLSLRLSGESVVGLSCARGEPFRDAATVNYEDRDPPDVRRSECGRAKGQMPDFRVATIGEYTASPTAYVSKQD